MLILRILKKKKKHEKHAVHILKHYSMKDKVQKAVPKFVFSSVVNNPITHYEGLVLD